MDEGGAGEEDKKKTPRKSASGFKQQHGLFGQRRLLSSATEHSEKHPTDPSWILSFYPFSCS
jgi:hypothetical protein